MASKIETSLTPEQLHEFLKRCAQLKGSKLKDIQAIAEEFGIDVSLMGARSFKQGAFSEYLDELKSKREMAEQVSALAKNGLSLSDGAASVFAQKVFDASLSLTPQEIGGKEANNLSLAISRLRAGDQRAQRLEADLKLRDEQLSVLQRERTEWEEQRAQIAAATKKVRTATPATADEVRAAAVAEIDRIMGITK